MRLQLLSLQGQDAAGTTTCQLLGVSCCELGHPRGCSGWGVGRVTGVTPPVTLGLAGGETLSAPSAALSLM